MTEEPDLVRRSLRTHRVNAGLSQQDVADRAGVSLRTVRNLEIGRPGRPRPSSVRRVAVALGVPSTELDRLLGLLEGDPPSGVRVDILGSLAVYRAGSPIELTGLLCRRLLGALALQAGQPVSQDELIDLLWGPRPPRRAAAQLGVHVARLRSALRPAGSSHDSQVLVRAGHGYRLDVDPEQVDRGRFERALRSARSQSGAAAVAGYAEALAVWRGPVLVDLGQPLREHPAAVAAAMLRATAVAEAVDVALAHGVPGQALDWLRVTLPDEPLHEGLHARMVRTLTAAGEPAAAVRHYAAVRSLLVDELGVEPAAELRAAHLAALRHDQPEVGHAPPGDVPNLLPADLTAFAGRAGKLAQLDGFLADRDAASGTPVVIVAVSGTAGVGKTALVVHWAHHVGDAFPDGRLYVNLRGYDPSERPVEPAEAVRGLLDALGVPPERVPSQPDAQAARYRSLLAGKRMLVVLDNARDTDQVRPLLPGAGPGLVVVTSRDRLTGLVATEGAHPVTLDLLTDGESRQLLARRLGADRLRAEPGPVDRIVAACARLPLALAVAAARAQQTRFPLGSVADELAESVARLDALDAGDSAGRVEAVFSWSYAALTPPAARLFRLLGVHHGPDISRPAAASLAGRPLAETRSMLAELVQASLLTERAPGRYTWHDLLRAYASRLAASTDREVDRHAALIRLLDHYVHTAHAAVRLLKPDRDPIALPLAALTSGAAPETLADEHAATAWFTAEYPVLLAALEWAAGHRADAQAWRLAWALDTFVHRRANWPDLGTAWRTGLAAATRLGDPTLQALAHRRIAVADTRLRRYRDAHRHLEQARALYLQVGNLVGEARTESDFAVLSNRRQQFHDALSHGQRAFELFQAAGHELGQALALNHMGWYQIQLGDYAGALAHCGQALAINRRLGYQQGEASTWDSLGYAHHHLSRYPEAVTCYRHAIALFRDIGDPNEEATTLTNLGDTHRAAGDHAAARDCWERAHGILTAIDPIQAEAVQARLQPP